jgi:2-polyprenyl-6-methoxyphenol hydroxylase-like FAD-dependent oxidoreductase
VIIVGAGPAGLLLAILLAQHRIPSIVLEAQPGLDTRLRATQYGVPATRVFRRAGIIDDIRSGSIPSFPSIVWRRTADHEVLTGIDMSCVADHEDRMTIMPLNELTKVMLRHCVDGVGKGVVDVRFGHRVVGLGQDELSAWVDVEIGDGEAARKDRLQADYVIGCDGASSVVRKSLFGRDWPGQTFPHKLLVQNVWYDGFETHGWKGGNYMVDPDYWGLIARRGQGGLWRVTYGDVDGFTEEEYLKRRETRLEKMLPGHPKPDQYRVGDTNFYRMHNRCVTSMRVGRVLLCADAAHICNPWGGYGCMSAVVDAGGLAECLIGLYEGKAGEDILDTYAEVRREKFLKYVDGRSIKNLERISKTDPWTVLETDKFFGILKELNGDPEATRAFLLVSEILATVCPGKEVLTMVQKYSSIEYDFTQHYQDAVANGHAGQVKSEK